MIYKSMMVVALTIVGLVMAQSIIVPIAFAAVFAVVLLPLVKKLEKRKVPSALAIAIVLVLSIVVIAGLTTLAITQITALVTDLPDIEAKFRLHYSNLQVYLSDNMGISLEKQTDYTDQALRSAGTWLAGSLSSVTNVLSTVLQLPVYIFLFLIYRSRFKTFFDSIIPKSESESTWQKDIQQVIMGYLTGMVMVIAIIAVLNTAGLLILGIEHAIFFGILSGVLTVIPYIGNLIGATFPILLALITRDSIWTAVGVVIVFVIVQFLEGNFITPRITASRISINAFAAIVALFIGGMILGIAGMILSVPAVGILKIILGNIPQTKPFVILLGDETPLGTKDKVNEKIIAPQ